MAKFLDLLVPPTESSHGSRRRHRTSSNDSENVEEGISTGFDVKGVIQPIQHARPTQNRVNIGTRKSLIKSHVH